MVYSPDGLAIARFFTQGPGVQELFFSEAGLYTFVAINPPGFISDQFNRNVSLRVITFPDDSTPFVPNEDVLSNLDQVTRVVTANESYVFQFEAAAMADGEVVLQAPSQGFSPLVNVLLFDPDGQPVSRDVLVNGGDTVRYRFSTGQEGVYTAIVDSLRFPDSSSNPADLISLQLSLIHI